MHKWIAVTAATALFAAGALAQRGVGRGSGGGATQPRTVPANRVETKQRQQTAGTQAPRQATKTVEFKEAERARLQPMLPAGMPVETAAEGFRNRGQFMAAVQVSRNLGIPFEDLKARMTGPDAQPLGRAIQDLRPAMTSEEAKEAVRTAERQAREQERQMKREEKRHHENQPPAQP
jgi:hypothetical protein